jgi:hypothetical protein
MNKYSHNRNRNRNRSVYARNIHQENQSVNLSCTKQNKKQYVNMIITQVYIYNFSIGCE